MRSRDRRRGAVCRGKPDGEQPARFTPPHARRDGHLSELCACRAAGLLQRFHATTSTQSLAQLSDFLNERWKGIQPVARAMPLRESEFTRWVYQGLCGLEKEHNHEI